MDKTRKHNCAICGKPTPNPIWFEFTGGSLEKTVFPDGSADENDPGYMGCHPVGANCAKKFPREHRIKGSFFD